VAVSKLVNSLKGVSSHLIRKKNYPSIWKKLWGKALWSPSYFAERRSYFYYPTIY
jgi:putative transposase